MAVKLDWVDNNPPEYNEDGHKVYRSATPIDVNSPPAPIATLAADIITYTDTDPAAGGYYRVSAYRGSVEAFSDEIQIGSASVLSSLSGDEITSAWYTNAAGPAIIHHSGKTYTGYIADTPPQTAKLVVYDHGLDAVQYSVVDTNLIRDDSHGMPALCVLSDGRLTFFHGSHNSAQEWSISDASGGAPDITAWTRQAALGSMTYPKPVNIPDGSGGGTLYLFGRDAAQDFFVQSAVYTSGGAVTFGARQKLIDYGGRVYAAEVRAAPDGNIEFFTTYADTSDTFRRNVYYYKYRVDTGDLENIDASVSRAVGTQPVNRSDSDADFREFDTGTNISGVPSWCRDAAGDLHVVYGNDTAPIGSLYNINHAKYSSGSWTAPQTAFQMYRKGSQYVDTFCVTSMGSGDSVRAVYASGNAGSWAARGGDDMVYKDYAGGSWGAEVVLNSQANGRALANPTSIDTPHPDYRYAWCEAIQTVNESDRATLLRYGHGDSGFVQWPAFVDDQWLSVVFLLGSSGGAPVDVSPWGDHHAVSLTGTPVFDGAKTLFGQPMIRFQGGDALTIPRTRASNSSAGSELRLRSGCVIEMFIELNNIGTDQYIMSSRSGSSAQDGIIITVTSSNVIRVLGWNGSGVAVNIYGTTALAANQSYYVAVKNNGGSIELWIDGVLDVSGGSTPADGGDITVGRNPYTSDRNLDGWISQLRFTTTARDVSTVPAAAFPVG